ncbi:hypothetical protein D3C71_1520460 [compost metagenome]
MGLGHRQQRIAVTHQQIEMRKSRPQHVARAHHGGQKVGVHKFLHIAIGRTDGNIHFASDFLDGPRGTPVIELQDMQYPVACPDFARQFAISPPIAPSSAKFRIDCESLFSRNSSIAGRSP